MLVGALEKYVIIISLLFIVSSIIIGVLISDKDDKDKGKTNGEQQGKRDKM